MFKVSNNLVPHYIEELIPPLVGNRTQYELREIPNIYSIGNRNILVLHARLRNNCSNLNEDLYQNHLRLDPMCQCGNEIENAEHYFFKCSRYIDIRTSLFRATRAFHPLSVHKLLFGIANLSYNQNCLPFQAVHVYIKDSKRFVYFFVTVLQVFCLLEHQYPTEITTLFPINSLSLSVSLSLSLSACVCICVCACNACVCICFFPFM